MKTKQLIFSLIAFVAIVLSSCSDEQAGIAPGSGGMQTLSFRLTTEEQAQTRAGGTAPAVQDHTLKYYAQVFNNVTGDSIPGSWQASNNGVFNITLPLGSAYTCLFWAHYVPTAGGGVNPYFKIDNLKAVTLKQHLTGADQCQAFCGTATIDAGVESGATQDVTLKRAVSQVNIKSATQLKGYSKLTVEYANVPNTFNVATNEASKTTGSAVNGSEPGTFEVTDFTAGEVGGKFTYQSAYFLAPGSSAGQLLNIALNTYNTASTNALQTLSIGNVPTKKNYKTNVVVTFDPASIAHSYDFAFEDWGGDIDYEPVSVWDGTPATGNSGGSPFSGGTGTVADPYILASATDFAQFAADVNAGCTYENKYFKLDTNIDLDDKSWAPIGWKIDGTTPPVFKGYFNGSHHKVINMKVDYSSTNPLGLFGSVENGSIKGLHVRGTIEQRNYIANITSIGGLVGSITKSIVQDCSFDGTITPSYSYSGGMVGIAKKDNANAPSQIIASKSSGEINSSGMERAGIVAYANGVKIVACYSTMTGVYFGMAQKGDSEINEIAGCYSIGCELMNDDTQCSISAPCYSTEAKKLTNVANELQFAVDAWPDGSSAGVWYAAPANDGTENKYWKSIGSWNNGSPVYPKLWWEK